MTRHVLYGAVLATLAAMIPVSAAAQSDGDPLTLRVSPLVMFAESDASVRLRLQPDARSRALTIEWFSGEGGGGSHLINLEGERSAITHRFDLKRLDAGEYTVSVLLQRSDGTRVRRVANLIVLSCGCASSTESSARQKRLRSPKGPRG